MSVVVSQRNRAVSQVAIEAVATTRRYTPSKLFALPGGNNVLNGTFFPFTPSTDSGWWGDALSDANGYLPAPAVMTVTKHAAAYELTLVGIEDNYPVDFEVSLYLGGVLLTTRRIRGNTSPELAVNFGAAYEVDSYVLTITRISKPYDVLKVATASFGINISGLMKEPGRRIRGKVEVTYANALRSVSQEASASSDGIMVSEGAYGSSTANVIDTRQGVSAKFFTLYDNKLDGSYKTIGPASLVGWWPKTLPVGTTYQTPQTLSLRFSTRNIYGFSVYGDATSGDYPSEYKVVAFKGSTVAATYTVTGHTLPDKAFPSTLYDIDRLDITIYKSSRANRPAVITEVSIVTSILYEDDKLISVNLLEELSYEDSIEKLGGVSANELTVVFNNEDRSFYFNNAESPVANYLKKNRKVQAWFGVELPGTDTVAWSLLGTFWTHDWDVPVGSLTAKAVAFDTLGLLSTRPYTDHHVYRNKSIGWLIEQVLTSAKQQISFIDWLIEDELYDTVIPVAWFSYASYTAALNRIAACDFINIYCDREGRIVATKRLSGVQSPDDVWSDDTNIVSKSYPTLNTSVPNYIDVKVSRVSATVQEVLKLEGLMDTVQAGEVRLFNFTSPVEYTVDVTIDSSATYEYEWFSWGMRVTFSTAGTLRGVIVNAMSISVDTNTSVHLQNTASVEEDGTIPCEIVSDFIQSVEHAQSIATYLYDKLTTSVYDAEVTYRGDISLALNSKVSMPDGIAPNNLYVIKRHELHWNGSLSGSARLST